MQNNPRKVLGRVIGAIFFILIILFGFNRFGRYINGPEITSISIEEYTETQGHVIFIEGSVKNTSEIKINNNDIAINDNLNFKEILTVNPGHSLVEIYVYDTFGKRRKYEYQIFNTNSDTLYQATYNEATANTEIQDDLKTIIN